MLTASASSCSFKEAKPNLKALKWASLPVQYVLPSIARPLRLAFLIIFDKSYSGLNLSHKAAQ